MPLSTIAAQRARGVPADYACSMQCGVGRSATASDRAGDTRANPAHHAVRLPNEMVYVAEV